MVSIAIKHPWIISSVHGLSSGLYYQQWNVQEQYLTEFAWAPGSHILTQLYLYYKLHYEKCVISALSCRCGMASMTTIFIGLCEYLMNFFPALISLATLLMFASTLSWKQKTFLQGVTLLESLIVVKCKQTRQKIWISLEDAGEAWHFWTDCFCTEKYWTCSAANFRHICTVQTWVMHQPSHKRLACGIHIFNIVICHVIVHHVKTLE